MVFLNRRQPNFSPIMPGRPPAGPISPGAPGPVFPTGGPIPIRPGSPGPTAAPNIPRPGVPGPPPPPIYRSPSGQPIQIGSDFGGGGTQADRIDRGPSSGGGAGGSFLPDGTPLAPRQTILPPLTIGQELQRGGGKIAPPPNTTFNLEKSYRGQPSYTRSRDADIFEDLQNSRGGGGSSRFPSDTGGFGDSFPYVGPSGGGGSGGFGGGGGGFGGGGLGGLDQGTPGGIEQVSTLNPQQEGTLASLGATYGPLIGQSALLYNEDLVAPLTGTQEQLTGPALQEMISSIFGQGGMNPQIQQALSRMLSGQPSTEVNKQLTEEYFNRGIRDPALRDFEDIVTSTQEAHAGPGFFSSGKGIDLRQNEQDLAQYLAGERSRLVYGDEQTRIGLAESAANRVQPAAATGSAFGGRQLSQLGQATQLSGIPQAQQQRELDSAFNEWQRTSKITDPEVLEVMRMILGLPATQNIVVPGAPGPAQSLGTLAQAGQGDIGSQLGLY